MSESRSYPILLILVIGIYGAYVLSSAVNVPWFDDIDAFVDAFLLFDQAPTIWAKGKELIEPNNEHRMWLGKTAGIVLTYMTGELNFKWLIWIQNLVLLGIIYLLHQLHGRYVWTLLIALFILTPQYHLSSNWAITGWQHIGVLAMGLLTLVCLLRYKDHLITFSCLFLTIFTMSNGMLFWTAGLVLLFLRRDWRLMLLWFVVGLLGVWLYFYGFDSSTNQQAFSYFRENPGLSIACFFVFIGNNGDWFKLLPLQTRGLIAGLWGFLFLSWMLWNAWRFWTQVPDAQKSEKLWVLVGFLVFLLGNALLIGILRARYGFEVMLVGNYRIYSAFFFGFTVLWHVWINKTLGKSTNQLPLLVFGFTFFFVSYFISWPEIDQRKRNLLAAAFNQEKEGIGLAAQRGSFLLPYIDEKMKALSKAGHYHYPSYFPTTLIERLPYQPARAGIHLVQQNDWLYHDPIQEAEAVYMVFSQGKHRYVLPMSHPQAANRFGMPVSKPGYILQLPRLFFEKETYQVSFLYLKSNNFTPIHTSHTVLIDQ